MFEAGLPITRSWSTRVLSWRRLQDPQVLNGVEIFAFGAKTYVSNVCEKIEKLMGITLKKFEIPQATGDHPETEDTGLQGSDDHSLTGCYGQWSVTLGRFDVMFAIQTMARFSAAPKDGHLRRIML